MKTFKQFLNEAKIVGIYPHGEGVDIHDDGEKGDVSNHNTEKTVGNEPFKDTSYFRRPKMKEYIGNIRRSFAKKKSMPPVLGTPHPQDSSVRSVIDGNHRLRGAKTARVGTVPTENVSHDNIRLMPRSYAETENKGTIKQKVESGVTLSSLRNPDGSYDMNKPRKELGGKTIGHYFVRPDGSHDFKSPKK